MVRMTLLLVSYPPYVPTTESSRGGWVRPLGPATRRL